MITKNVTKAAVDEFPSEWLEVARQGWSTLKMKHLFRERSTKGFPELPLLAATQRHGVILKSSYETKTVIAEKDLHLLKLVEPGDFVISLRSFEGGIEVSHERGIISPAYTVLTPLNPDFGLYARYLLKSALFVSGLRLAVTGIREGQNIDYSVLGETELPVPPAGELGAIAGFLSHTNQRIDRFVRSKRKLIALLEEQKQAIINQAVTGGLDPDAPLKPSGIQWLGEIPQHWNVNPLKRLLSKMDYGISDPSRSGARYRVLSMAHVSNGSVNIPDGERVGVDSFPNELVLCDGDLLFNRTNSPELVGKVGHFEGKGDEEITFASYLVRLQVATSCEPRWLNYLLNSEHVWSFAKSQALVSLHQANLNPTRYGRIQLPVPPKNEQFDLVVHLDRECALFSDLISKAQREIRLVEEYRTRLISDVVTGQLDVREAEIPDTHDGDATLDELLGEGVSEFEEELEFAEAEA